MSEIGTFNWAREQAEKGLWVRHNSWEAGKRITEFESTNSNMLATQMVYQNGTSFIGWWNENEPKDGWELYSETEELYKRLIKKLKNATEEQKITWEKYSSQKMIGAKFKTGYVVLEKTTDVVLEIWDSFDTLLDTFEPKTDAQKEELEKLFDFAWKRVTNFENILASIEYDLDNL